jgi:exosortase
MEVRPISLASDRQRAPVAVALIVILGLVAYSRLLWPGPGATDVAHLLFRPGTVPPPLAVAVAAFVLWRRRARLRSLPGPGAPLPAVGLAAIGTGLFVWAGLTGDTRHLLPSLAANGLAVATAARGWAGWRAVLAPACILLLAIPLPKPLEDEIVWQLQRGTASAAGWMLNTIGHDVVQDGVILRGAEHTFHVIDGCSGLSGIAILLLVALVVRELFADTGPRTWTLVALAPPLGFALNVLRVAFVAASPDVGRAASAGIESDHTIQGLAVLMIGTAVLYAVGRAMAPSTQDRAPVAGASSSAVGAPARIGVIAGVAGLALLSWTLPRFPEASLSSRTTPLEFPEQKSGWTSEYAPNEPLFYGMPSGGAQRRYRLELGPNRPPQVVDFLVGFENVDSPDSFRLLCSKLSFPGPDWNLVERRRERIWLLDRAADLAVFSRGEEHAVTYAWRPRDRGLWRESWRAWLGLESTPFRRERPRAAVRLVAYAPHDGQIVLDRAKQRLDRFVRDFREELNAL